MHIDEQIKQCEAAIKFYNNHPMWEINWCAIRQVEELLLRLLIKKNGKTKKTN